MESSLARLPELQLVSNSSTAKRTAAKHRHGCPEGLWDENAVETEADAYKDVGVALEPISRGVKSWGCLVCERLRGISSSELDDGDKRFSDVLVATGWAGSGYVLGKIEEKKGNGERVRLKILSPSWSLLSWPKSARKDRSKLDEIPATLSIGGSESGCCPCSPSSTLPSAESEGS